MPIKTQTLLHRYLKNILFSCTILWCGQAYSQDFSKSWTIQSVPVWRFSLNTHSKAADSRRILREIRASAKIQFQYPDSALALLQKASNESIIIGDFERTAVAQTNMGLAALSKGDFASSFKYFDEAKKFIWISGTERKHLSALYVDIGAAYSYQNNYQKAFEYYYAILQYMIKEIPGDDNIVMTQNNIADVLIRMEQYDKALYYIEQAELWARNTNAQDMLSYLFANRASIALATGNIPAVKKYADQGLELALKFDNKEAAQCLYILKADYYLKIKEPKTAISYLDMAMQSNNDIYPLLAFIEPTYTLGFAYYQAGDYAQAEKTIMKALNMANKLNVDPSRLEALGTLASIYEKTGKYKQAIALKNTYDSLKDEMQEMEKRTMSNALEVKYRTAQKDKVLIQNELLIEKQNRDLEDKNIMLLGSIISLLIIAGIAIVIYLYLKNRNRITALNAKLEGEEIERTRIAAELHDGIGGMLAVIKMRLTSKGAADASDNEVISLLNETSKQVRTTAHNLMPNVVNDFTLKEALTHYVENVNHAQQNLKVDLEIHSALNLTKVSVKLSIYRMLQEVIQNIIKHAKATHAIIQIFEQPGRLHLLIEDNGIGFDLTKIKKGLGIINLENRVELMNGSININSTPGAGTTINIEIEI